jgi:hypothetical protein
MKNFIAENYLFSLNLRLRATIPASEALLVEKNILNFATSVSKPQNLHLKIFLAIIT